jgi:hypothetical protein
MIWGKNMMIIFIPTYMMEEQNNGITAFCKKSDFSSYTKISITVTEKLMVITVMMKVKRNNQLSINLN